MSNVFKVIVLAVGAQFSATALLASPVKYDLPSENAALKPGPGVDVAQANCGTCHSADYVNTQPSGAGFGKDFWQAEVTKMIKVYGAPIPESDAKTIVDYLAATYR